MAAATIDDIDVHLRAIISNLYYLIVQAHEHQRAGTQNAMRDEIKRLTQNLLTLSQTAQRLPTHIPEEVIDYVEDSRNPDIYTRQLVELVMKYNQELKGRSEAFASFRDILGQQMITGIPEMKEDVQKVVQASGGHVE